MSEGFTLAELVADLVAVRHTGGYRFKVPERVLRQFAEHCQREGYADGSITSEALDGFLYGRHLRSSTVRRNELTLRQLAEHARTVGWDAHVPTVLVRWLTTGDAPPHAPRIDVDPATKQIVRDADGIALGGIRTPPLDVPVAVLSGAPGPNPSVICLLLGSTKPLSVARLGQLYPSRDAYDERYEDATDRVIRRGFVLRADRGALLAFADPSRIAG